MNLPKHFSKTLKNDLEVVVIPINEGSNVITTDIFYRVGSRNEVMGKSGIAHMLEHMNFKSTKNLKEGEFDKIVKSIGGVDNASTGFDYTHYYIKSSSEYLEKSLELFSEVMQNLSLNDEEFQRERKVVYEERLWRTDNNPIGYLFFRLFNNSFIYHPYHWTPIGFKDDILNWSIEDIRNFHKTFYQPKNAMLIVVGDVKADDVFDKAEKYFENIENSIEIPEVHQKEPTLDGDKNITIYKESEVEMVAINYHIPPFNHEDQVKLSALTELLSSGKSSILQKKLLDEKSLVNQIYGYNMELIDDGVFMFLAVCNPDIKAEEVESEIKDIIQNYEITQKELDKLKINTKMDFISSLESASDVANLYGSYLIRGDLNPLLEYEEKINSLTIEDLMDMKKYFTNSVTVKLKPSK
jgi:predicted Zn-dependent peptidase